MKAFKFFSIFLFFITSSSFAHLNNSDPIIKLKVSVNKVLDILYAEEELDFLDKEKLILDYMREGNDLYVLIRRSLGNNWKKISKDNQKSVLKLIEKIIVRAYIKGMLNRERPIVSFYETNFLSEKLAEIETQVKLSGDIFKIVYVYGKIKSEWVIFDIDIENISLVTTYRTQFDEFFNSNIDDNNSFLDSLKSIMGNEKNIKTPLF